MGNPATGSSLLFGLGLEQEYGVPGTAGLLGHRAVLPLKAGLAGEESDSPAVNQSGFMEPGVPGKKGGKIEWGMILTAAELLEPLEHICRAVTKTTLETGVYRYVFEPDNTGVDTSFYTLVSKVPVESWWLYGIKFGEVGLEIGDNEAVPVKLKGEIGHGTRLSQAVADEDNTGTYALGPMIRGPLKDRTAGDVYVKVTDNSPLTFKVEQTTGTPTFAGAAVEVAIDGVTGRAVWQNLQGDDGLDLGIWDENRDPLEIIWPGTATDHEDLAVNDVFRFNVAWQNPSVPFLSGHQTEFTSAHWTVRARVSGASVWQVKRVNTGSVTVNWPITVDRGSTSRYPFALTRDGQFMVELELNRNLVDSFFVDAGEKRSRLETELAFEGRQVGTGAHREGITFTCPRLRIDDDTRDAANEKAVKEKVKLSSERTDSGDPPATITVITTRNWTPST